MSNTLERAASCFDRVSRHEKGDQLMSTVMYYLGDRLAFQMTGEEKAKLRACLYSLLLGAVRAGRVEAEHQYRAKDAREVDDAASVLARAKLAWVLENFDNLTTED